LFLTYARDGGEGVEGRARERQVDAGEGEDDEGERVAERRHGFGAELAGYARDTEARDGYGG